MNNPPSHDAGVASAVALIKEALAILDGLADFELTAIHLQQAVDELEDHQSRHSPRA